MKNLWFLRNFWGNWKVNKPYNVCFKKRTHFISVVPNTYANSAKCFRFFEKDFRCEYLGIKEGPWLKTFEGGPKMHWNVFSHEHKSKHRALCPNLVYRNPTSPNQQSSLKKSAPSIASSCKKRPQLKQASFFKNETCFVFCGELWGWWKRKSVVNGICSFDSFKGGLISEGI